MFRPSGCPHARQLKPEFKLACNLFKTARWVRRDAEDLLIKKSGPRYEIPCIRGPLQFEERIFRETARLTLCYL